MSADPLDGDEMDCPACFAGNNYVRIVSISQSTERIGVRVPKTLVIRFASECCDHVWAQVWHFSKGNTYSSQAIGTPKKHPITGSK